MLYPTWHAITNAKTSIKASFPPHRKSQLAASAFKYCDWIAMRGKEP